MPVPDHPVHEKTRISSDTPYRCASAKRKHGYWTYQRTYYEDGSFSMGYSYIEDVMSKLCRNTMRDGDPRCGTCTRPSDEEYLRGQ